MPSVNADILEDLSELVRRERGSLAALARAEGMSAEEALECVQDALATYLTRHGDFEAEGVPALATLKAMVRNAARNARRKHARAKHHASITPDAEPPGEDTRVDELLSDAEDVVRLRLCVAELCDIQRAVVMLRLLEERSGEDVAATLRVTRGYVDVLVHRARASLHVCMRAPRPAAALRSRA